MFFIESFTHWYVSLYLMSIKSVKLFHDSCRFIASVILSSHFISFKLDLIFS